MPTPVGLLSRGSSVAAGVQPPFGGPLVATRALPASQAQTPHSSTPSQRFVTPAAPLTAAVASVSSPPQGLEAGYHADQNAAFRKYMEDDYTVVEDFADRRGSLYCGLYDGHGGRLAVDFVAKNLHGSIERELRSGPAGDAPLEAMRRGFLKCDRQLLQCGAMQVGTTVAVCLCLPGPNGQIELHAANAGDSRIVLISEHAPTRLSVDHVATDPVEVRRVQELGGRVVNQRVGSVLAVTRALGDHALKSGSGLTADPHCVAHTCAVADRFVLLASDGLWDVLSDGDAHRIVLQHAHLAPSEIAAKLVQAALDGGTRDNVSALVLRLR